MLGKCAACGAYRDLEEHHCMGGRTGNRKKSDKYPELKFDLCHDCHQGTNGVHGKNGAALALKLKRIGQTRFVAKHGMVKWMELFGRNYL